MGWVHYSRGCEVKFQSFLWAWAPDQVPMSSANLRFQKWAVPDFSLSKRSPATGLAAAITINRVPIVHCLLYFGGSNNSDGCTTPRVVGLNFCLSYGHGLRPRYLMSSANLRFQKWAVPHFSLSKRSPATGLTAPITIIRVPIVHCLLYFGGSNNSDGCTTPRV